MKAYEFPTKITSDGKLELPDNLLKILQDSQTVRVVVFISEPDDIDEQAIWSRLTSEQFLAGYDEKDSVYDKI